MPMLDNARHEAFAHAMARGATAHDAYIEAGYNPNRHNAHRLRTKESVVNRVGELKALVQKMQKCSSLKVVLDRDWLVQQLIEIVFIAKSQDKPDLAGANKALHLLGLQLGMFVERKETGTPGEFDGLTVANKRERVLEIARQLGLDRISANERSTD
jgi:phage terminase small subunit